MNIINEVLAELLRVASEYFLYYGFCHSLVIVIVSEEKNFALFGLATGLLASLSNYQSMYVLDLFMCYAVMDVVVAC